MLYDLKADAFRMTDRLEQQDRSRKAARQRLVREALAGRQERTTNPGPGVLDRLHKLAHRASRTTTEPAL